MLIDIAYGYLCEKTQMFVERFVFLTYRGVQWGALRTATAVAYHNRFLRFSFTCLHCLFHISISFSCTKMASTLPGIISVFQAGKRDELRRRTSRSSPFGLLKNISWKTHTVVYTYISLVSTMLNCYLLI